MQVPTTVMATVDSSVGGKTGVNHPLGKNMIGAFYQPQCVLIDTDTLITLPDRELASGISEIVKYGLIRDAPLFEWLEENMDRLMQRDPEVLPLENKRKHYAFRCQFYEKPSIMPGCPVLPVALVSQVWHLSGRLPVVQIWEY